MTYRPQWLIRIALPLSEGYDISPELSNLSGLPAKSGVYLDKTCFIYHLDYPEDSPISSQSFRYVSAPENFITQIVACRTFLTKQEADQLLDAGLCQRVSSQDVLVFDKDGPIENKMLFPEECARHKLLDMLGDFSLGQCDWVGEFVAFRSGHHLNVECVKALLDKTVYIESDVVPIHKNLFTRKD